MTHLGSRASHFAIPKSILLNKILPFLEADLLHGDLSSSFIPVSAVTEAKIISKSTGILAGLQEAKLMFEHLGIEINSDFEDGNKINPKDFVMQIKGRLRDILMVERTALNFLTCLSAIASSTADYITQIRSISSNTILAATRKITPGFGWFEKKAVYYGGGDPHRWNLGDMVMFKDTHLAYFNQNISKMLQSARKNLSFSKKIEIEIEDPALIHEAIANGAEIIMLDNMDPITIKNTIKRLEKIPPHVLFEASGNITLDNIGVYAASGVNIISTSAPILRPHHSMDFSLRLLR
jgi:nicotinate-nucleotide pyrophosphorylase (carboxylating)